MIELEPRALTRKFLYGGVRLKDPDPVMTPDEVLRYYANLGVYPDLLNATVAGGEVEDGVQLYTFERAVGTKGVADENVDEIWPNVDRAPTLAEMEQLHIAIDRDLNRGAVTISVDELAYLHGLLGAEMEREQLREQEALLAETVAAPEPRLVADLVPGRIFDLMPELRWPELEKRGTVQEMVSLDEDVVTAAWAPGSGTLYRFALVKLGAAGTVFGAADRSYLFTLYRASGPHLSWPVGNSNLLVTHYVREKLGLEGDDLLAVTALLNLLLPAYDLEYGDVCWREIRRD